MYRNDPQRGCKGGGVDQAGHFGRGVARHSAADRSGADHERRTRFGGQAFIPASLEKIAQLRALADELGTETIIEVDGGISSHNAHEVFGAGADVLVAGNAVFGAEDPQAEIVKMLNA